MITAMSIWDAAGLAGKALNCLQEGPGFESVYPPHDVWRFTFFPEQIVFFYLDNDIIGSYGLNNSTHCQCYIIGLTYDTMVQIIANIIYDIICMI